MRAELAGAPDARGPVGWLWEGHGLIEDLEQPILTSHECGDGTGWYLAVDLFGHYARTGYYGVRNLIASIVGRALPVPAARATGSLPVECALRSAGEDLLCHLVNINTVSRNNRIETQISDLPTVCEVRATVRCSRPTDVLDAVTGERLSWTHEDGRLEVAVGELPVIRSVRVCGAAVE